MLTKQLADEIVMETMNRLNRNVNIIDITGTIIASGDTSRLGEYHEAAAFAIKQDRILVINHEKLHQWRGSQIGVNMPIHFNLQVIGAIGISGDPLEVEPFVQLVTMATELLIRQHYSKLQDEWQQITCDLIIEELLEYTDSGPNNINVRLDLIRYALRPPYRVVVIFFSFLPKSTDESILLKVRRIMLNSHVIISHYRPQRLILLFSETKTEEIVSKLTNLVGQLKEDIETVFIGMGSTVESRENIRRSYWEAESALTFGNHHRGSIAFYEEIEGQALVNLIPEEHRIRLLEKKFSRNLSDKMLETLQNFFICNLNLAATATQLGIHRNTLIYRLERIKDSTGYDPQRFQDAFILQIIIWLRHKSL